MGCIHMHIHTYTYTYTYTHIHIHIHTRPQPKLTTSSPYIYTHMHMHMHIHVHIHTRPKPKRTTSFPYTNTSSHKSQSQNVTYKKPSYARPVIQVTLTWSESSFTWIKWSRTALFPRVFLYWGQGVRGIGVPNCWLHAWALLCDALPGMGETFQAEMPWVFCIMRRSFKPIYTDRERERESDTHAVQLLVDKHRLNVCIWLCGALPGVGETFQAEMSWVFYIMRRSFKPIHREGGREREIHKHTQIHTCSTITSGQTPFRSMNIKCMHMIVWCLAWGGRNIPSWNVVSFLYYEAPFQIYPHTQIYTHTYTHTKVHTHTHKYTHAVQSQVDKYSLNICIHACIYTQ
jgi:hypothetical protein